MSFFAVENVNASMGHASIANQTLVIPTGKTVHTWSVSYFP